jgi:hypothetical protein
MATPGLTLGPQDIDSAGELTARLGVHNKAATLLRRHAALYPAELRTALSLPVDQERTAALDAEEVLSVLSGLQGRRAFFDADVHVVEDASVRSAEGTRLDEDRVVSIVFRADRSKGGSGRSGRGVIPYSQLSGSIRAFEDARDRPGAPAIPIEGSRVAASGEVDADLAARLDALEQSTRDAEERARAAEESRADLEARLARAENPEPFENYDELDADDVARQVKEGGLEEFGTAGLQRILTYEQSTKNRKTVTKAVESALSEPKGPTS